MSERQLRRRFAERVGYSPKTLQRVLRFQRLVSILGEPGAELARAAPAAGYSDQAHLNRECRALSGLTPAELARWLQGTGDGQASEPSISVCAGQTARIARSLSDSRDFRSARQRG